MKAVMQVMLLLAPGAMALSVKADAQADRDGFWAVQTSVYTRHFSPSPEHDNRQNLIGLERNEASGLVYGGATFRNSFAQRSVYGYVGKRFNNSRYPAVYLKVTGGLLHGYRGEYRDKIPLNRYGVAPVIIPGVGVTLGPVVAEAVLLGTSATMLNAGFRF
ncbi:sn-glycerol-3-phosphate transporter [Pseudomonas sp. 3A(2025)]